MLRIVIAVLVAASLGLCLHVSAPAAAPDAVMAAGGDGQLPPAPPAAAAPGPAPAAGGHCAEGWRWCGMM